MKKIYLLILFPTILFANNIELSEKKEIKTEVKSKCDIVYGDVYNYCIDKNFTTEAATRIANAAKTECNRFLKTSTN
jgi:hypothetical protein